MERRGLNCPRLFLQNGKEVVLSHRKRSMPFLTGRWLYAGKSLTRKQRNTPGTIQTGWGLSRMLL